MAYPAFHKLHEDFWDWDDVKPAFYDTDGSPVYEGPYQGLMGHIVARNDVAALRLYQNGPGKVFWEYECYITSRHPFFLALQSRSLDVFRALLEIYVADPIYTEPLEQYSVRIGFSPLNAACAFGDQDLTTWLLDHALTATLHDRDMFGKTPLFSAASVPRLYFDDPYSRDDATTVDMSKHEDFICFLLDRGCSVRDSNIYQKNEGTSDSANRIAELEQTVLGAAVTHTSYQMVCRLVAEGAEVHARQNWVDPTDHYHHRRSKGVTALHIASLFWNVEGIKALMDHCGDVSVAEMVTYADDNGRLPIHWALMGYRDEWYGSAPETSKDEDPIPPRMINTVKLLLEANPEIINARSDQGATVFNYAVKSDTGLANITILVNMLLGAKPLASTLSYYNPACPTALQDAVDNHSRRFGGLIDGKLFKLLEKLLANGVDAHLCLHRLCAGMWRGESISTVLIDRLLEGTGINDTDANGCTPMHYLIKRMDQIDAIRYLIKLGADVNVMDHKGNMPLHEVMKGTMMSKVDENGVRDPSQLWDSPYSRREELVKILVDAGGSMDQPNEAGQTPTQLLDEKREERRRQEARRLQSITR